MFRDHMTNKDVEKEQKTFGSPEQGTAPEKKLNKEEIYGPMTQPVDPNAPTGLISKYGSDNRSAYPQIYGPEFKGPPGGKDYDATVGKDCNATGEKSYGGDSSDPPPYDYVPAAEFPAGPLAPSPYLNDFSNILNYN